MLAESKDSKKFFWACQRECTGNLNRAVWDQNFESYPTYVECGGKAFLFTKLMLKAARSAAHLKDIDTVRVREVLRGTGIAGAPNLRFITEKAIPFAHNLAAVCVGGDHVVLAGGRYVGPGTERSNVRTS